METGYDIQNCQIVTWVIQGLFIPMSIQYQDVPVDQFPMYSLLLVNAFYFFLIFLGHFRIFCR